MYICSLCPLTSDMYVSVLLHKNTYRTSHVSSCDYSHVYPLPNNNSSNTCSYVHTLWKLCLQKMVFDEESLMNYHRKDQSPPVSPTSHNMKQCHHYGIRMLIYHFVLDLFIYTHGILDGVVSSCTICSSFSFFSSFAHPWFPFSSSLLLFRQTGGS